jgi:hypothetical protein
MVRQSDAAPLPAETQSPWQYHGIVLGRKMTETEVMQALGVTKFQIDPKYNPFGKETVSKYKLQAQDAVEHQIGPFCHTSSTGIQCKDPWVNTTLPDWKSQGHGAYRVVVFMDTDGTVLMIHVYFDASQFDEFVSAEKQQLGTDGWQEAHSAAHLAEPNNPSDPGRDVQQEGYSKRDVPGYEVSIAKYSYLNSHIDAEPKYQGSLEMTLNDLK